MMNSSAPHSSSDRLARSNYGDSRTPARTPISWGAIFAGTVAALALQVLFLMLGAGLGFSIYSPATESDPVANLSIGALIIHSIGAIISLFLGGGVAGWFSSIRSRSFAWSHGFIVWCTATVGGVVLVALGAGVMLGGLSKIIGGGLSAVGQPVSAVAEGAVDLGANALKRSEEAITSFVEEAVSTLPEDRPASEEIRATREVGMALARLFNSPQGSDQAANRADAIDALAEHTEMSEAEAERAVTEWTETYEGLRADLAAFQETAVEGAREAAEAASSALATVSIWSFFGFLLGAVAATGGGYLGGKFATACEDSDDAVSSARDTPRAPIRQERREQS